MKYLFDEDLPSKAAEAARNLGLDAESVHDEAQLRFTAREGRVFVTRNRDDFQALTFEFFRVGERHPGVFIVGRSFPGNKPERISHALHEWDERRKESPESFGAYVMDFL